MLAWPLGISSHSQWHEKKELRGEEEHSFFFCSTWCELSGHIRVANQTWLSDFWEHAATHIPPHHLHRLSTNAQRSWTTSIWGIILYEIDGWGQPLTERVKTTLRCPLWISMMENRLLKKIYVCSPLPQERATLPCTHPPQLGPIKHVIVVRLNSLALFSCQLCDNYLIVMQKDRKHFFPLGHAISLLQLWQVM